MNCFECDEIGQSVAAVAVCTVCGAGVCATHVRTETMQIREPAHPGKVMHNRSARRLTCPTCRAAEQAV
ncbi:DUF2180 family protein [Streptomyces sp. NPDC048002]|uniref:DUF2180 family protein n=1 Tax=Streptomyces sp. NPDC048002 TaxID=3154344 RepID=UPI0033E4F03F